MRFTKCTKFLVVATALITTSLFTQSSQAQSDPLYHYEQLDGTNPANAARSSKSEEPELAYKKDKVKDKDKDKDSPQSIPLDGGLSFFLIAGAGIAAKKRYDRKKAQA